MILILFLIALNERLVCKNLIQEGNLVNAAALEEWGHSNITIEKTVFD